MKEKQRKRKRRSSWKFWRTLIPFLLTLDIVIMIDRWSPWHPPSWRARWQGRSGSGRRCSWSPGPARQLRTFCLGNISKNWHSFNRWPIYLQYSPTDLLPLSCTHKNGNMRFRRKYHRLVPWSKLGFSFPHTFPSYTFMLSSAMHRLKGEKLPMKVFFSLKPNPEWEDIPHKNWAPKTSKDFPCCSYLPPLPSGLLGCQTKVKSVPGVVENQHQTSSWVAFASS